MRGGVVGRGGRVRGSVVGGGEGRVRGGVVGRGGGGRVRDRRRWKEMKRMACEG